MGAGSSIPVASSAAGAAASGIGTFTADTTPASATSSPWDWRPQAPRPAIESMKAPTLASWIPRIVIHRATPIEGHKPAAHRAATFGVLVCVSARDSIHVGPQDPGFHT